MRDRSYPPIFVLPINKLFYPKTLELLSELHSLFFFLNNKDLDATKIKLNLKLNTDAVILPLSPLALSGGTPPERTI